MVVDILLVEGIKVAQVDAAWTNAQRQPNAVKSSLSDGSYKSRMSRAVSGGCEYNGRQTRVNGCRRLRGVDWVGACACPLTSALGIELVEALHEGTHLPHQGRFV